MPEGPLGWVLELAGLAPGPSAGMMFVDHGAEVLRVDRVKAVSGKPRADVMDRGKHTIRLDLKSPDGVAAFKELTEQADVVVEVNILGPAREEGAEAARGGGTGLMERMRSGERP
ncbi:CoA transferase [Streptosporangium sp. NPDC003464]